MMDSFTDIDIFGDLQDAYNNRKVPVYILLDQDFLPHFLEMCKNLGVCPEQESVSMKRGWVWLVFIFCGMVYSYGSQRYPSLKHQTLERLKHPVCLVTDIKGVFFRNVSQLLKIKAQYHVVSVQSLIQCVKLLINSVKTMQKKHIFSYPTLLVCRSYSHTMQQPGVLGGVRTVIPVLRKQEFSSI